MSTEIETARKKVIGRPFQPGVSGNPKGRPKGSRDKLGQHFVHQLYLDWKQHGVKVLQEVREKSPQAYLRVIAMLMPQKVEADIELTATTHEMRVAERARLIEEYESRLLDITPTTSDTDKPARALVTPLPNEGGK
jgi:hypothetical protein